MSDNIQIISTYREDHWHISARVLPAEGNILPSNCFIYENNGTATLGQYYGVCNLEELQRLQVWAGAAVQKFGNRFVRYDIVEVDLPPGITTASTEANILNRLKSLKQALLASGQTTTVYPV